MSIQAPLKVSTPSDLEIRVERSFDAPPALVFDAWTKPDLLLQWFHGPEGWKLVKCEMDVRVKGAYRWVWRGSKGQEMGMGGVFLEISPPDRIVMKEKFDEAWYPGEAVVTMELKQKGKGTHLTTTIQYESVEARDIALNSDMTGGMTASYNQLAAFLAA